MGDRQLTLRGVVHREGDEWIAHCLDLDIVSCASTPHEATAQLVDAVTAQLEYARDMDNGAYLFHPAPHEAWQRLAAALQSTLPTLRMSLAYNEPPTLLELQVKAV